jgi:signal transduction histidine kinase
VFGLVGWSAALMASAVALAARREIAERRERIARASHEVRGALCAARLGLELARRRGELSAARVRALELELGRASCALDDLERLRLGRACDEIDARELLSDSVEAWHAVAAARGVELRLGWTGPDAIVFGERARLARATGNLIANAIEHGGGCVDVRGRLEGGAVRLEVTDAGTGLPAPVAELVGRAGGGHDARGRGLAIATEAARAHGGRLSAAPSDRGARLVLELPARPNLNRRSDAG